MGVAKGGVDAHERAMRPAELRYPGDVHAAQVGVGGGLCVGAEDMVRGLLCGHASNAHSMLVQGSHNMPAAVPAWHTRTNHALCLLQAWIFTLQRTEPDALHVVRRCGQESFTIAHATLLVAQHRWHAGDPTLRQHGMEMAVEEQCVSEIRRHRQQRGACVT